MTGKSIVNKHSPYILSHKIQITSTIANDHKHVLITFSGWIQPAGCSLKRPELGNQQEYQL